ncbi:MAG TPA: ribonuclease H [Gemmatimonadales bacterium]|nr:ribonuclease H [Gemmatimonadales bacterium]
MPQSRSGSIAIVHLDESCLGNGREGDNPGGAGGLIEVRTRSGIQRRDIYLSAPATTNNRMALAGAAETLEVLAAKGGRLSVLVVSDSEYLVKGMREWAPGWERRGWVRKGGAIENLALWQRLVAAARLHETQLTWVRGHKGHAKNEYANDLAILAARELRDSKGAVESGFLAWLETKRKRKLYLAYDPDEAFAALEQRMARGERFPHSDAALPLR